FRAPFATNCNECPGGRSYSRPAVKARQYLSAPSEKTEYSPPPAARAVIISVTYITLDFYPKLAPFRVARRMRRCGCSLASAPISLASIIGRECYAEISVVFLIGAM